jgi:hypothetical protein
VAFVLAAVELGGPVAAPALSALAIVADGLWLMGCG